MNDLNEKYLYEQYSVQPGRHMNKIRIKEMERERGLRDKIMIYKDKADYQPGE